MQKGKKVTALLCLCCCFMVCGLLTACGEGDLSATWEEGQQTEEDSNSAADRTSRNEEASDGMAEDQEAAGDSEAEDQETAGDSAAEEAVPTIYVQILGAVKEPGVYEVSEGSRLFQVVQLAGGFTKEACQESVNQASVVTDEQQIYVYTRQEAEELQESGGVGVFTGMGTSTVDDGGNSAAGTRVNINTAGKEQLMTLPGIGETKAESIVQYRENTGKFSSIEDIMKVDGIKEGVYNKIKEQITV